MKKKIIICAILFISSFLYAKAVTLNSASGDSVISYTTADGVKISLVSRLMKEEGTVRYVASIENNGTETFSFNENMISVFQGNSEENTWAILPHYTAESYINMKQSQNNAAAVAAGIGLGLAVLDAVTPDYHGYGPPPYRHGRPGYGPGPRRNVPGNEIAAFVGTLVGLGLTAAVVTSLLEDTNYTSEHLKTALLFNKEIGPGETYTGYFVSIIGNGPDYKVSLKISDSESGDFVFLRSDRNSILNPWSDSSSDKNCFVAGFSYAFETCGFNLGYIYCGQPVGCYFLTGINLRGSPHEVFGRYYSDSDIYFSRYDNNYISVSFTPNGNEYINSFSLNGGLTFALFPHFWLMAGCGFGIQDLYRQGDIQVTYSSGTYNYGNVWLQNNNGSFSCIPQLGFTSVFNYISFGGTFGWKIPSSEGNGPVVQVYLGLAY